VSRKGNNLESGPPFGGTSRPTYLSLGMSQIPSFLRMENGSPNAAELWGPTEVYVDANGWPVCRSAWLMKPRRLSQPIWKSATEIALVNQINMRPLPNSWTPNRQCGNWSEKAWSAGDGGWRELLWRLKHLLFRRPLSSNNVHRSRYEGGTARQIWKYYSWIVPEAIKLKPKTTKARIIIRSAPSGQSGYFSLFPEMVS